MNDLTTNSILALFQTSKEERQSFALDIISQLEMGDLVPLKIHLQIKAMEDLIKLITENTVYKSMVLEDAQKRGEKSFTFQNAKIEIKEVGTKYDFTKCGDREWEQWESQERSASNWKKEREKFLKAVPLKGIELLNKETGEMEMIYPPSKSSTTSIAVTLK